MKTSEEEGATDEGEGMQGKYKILYTIQPSYRTLHKTATGRRNATAPPDFVYFRLSAVQVHTNSTAASHRNNGPQRCNDRAAKYDKRGGCDKQDEASPNSARHGVFPFQDGPQVWPGRRGACSGAPILHKQVFHSCRQPLFAAHLMILLFFLVPHDTPVDAC